MYNGGERNEVASRCFSSQGSFVIERIEIVVLELSPNKKFNFNTLLKKMLLTRLGVRFPRECNSDTVIQREDITTFARTLSQT